MTVIGRWSARNPRARGDGGWTFALAGEALRSPDWSARFFMNNVVYRLDGGRPRTKGDPSALPGWCESLMFPGVLRGSNEWAAKHSQRRFPLEDARLEAVPAAGSSGARQERGAVWTIAGYADDSPCHLGAAGDVLALFLGAINWKLPALPGMLACMTATSPRYCRETAVARLRSSVFLDRLTEVTP